MISTHIIRLPVNIPHFMQCNLRYTKSFIYFKCAAGGWLGCEWMVTNFCAILGKYIDFLTFSLYYSN